MNENINIAELLENCAEGTKLYSRIDGEVSFCSDEFSERFFLRTNFGCYRIVAGSQSECVCDSFDG